MQITFCASVSDQKGLQALEILQDKGCQTRILQEGEIAPQTAVAIFSLVGVASNPIPGRYLRIAAHRLLVLRPGWAINTPFLAAINGSNRKWYSDRFAEAVLGLARMYENWFYSGARGLPWGGESSSEEQICDLEEWRDKVGCLPLHKLCWELTPSLHSSVRPSVVRKERGRSRCLRQPPINREIKRNRLVQRISPNISW